MAGKSHNDHEHIQGVRCVVTNCHYHCPGDMCSAGRIEIQHRNAKSSQETDCATFAPK
ncbi:MAG: DUF1540 domain-containing protein [Firmicutes bacterium]|nr:DUF1540 domain-containing protein [Bacillota bacterium]